MALHKLKKGLDLPIIGEPKQELSGSKESRKVALLGEDYVGMKPTMLVKEGDSVKAGDVLFTDKKLPEVKYTSPGCGKVVEINRGEKRAFKSIVIDLEGNEEVTFNSFSEAELKTLSAEKVKEQLLNSGQWTLIRVRPFSKVADPSTTPHSIFVTAMDTNPLAPSVDKLMAGKEKNFLIGLEILSKLTAGKVYVCTSPDSSIPVGDNNSVVTEEFDGPHPAGNAGTHIHFVDPVSRKKSVWYVNAQDVAAIGQLFTTGKIDLFRNIALCGASVKEPRLITVRVGADLNAVTDGELNEGENRIISGSVLSGRHATDKVAYLGRFHRQVTVISEDREKHFLGWLSPGANLYSMKNIVLSKLIPGKRFDFTTSQHGGQRAIVPSGNFEKVMPLDIIPTYLLRALAVNDVEEAEKLGVLELDEEDVALCTFSCPSKLEYGPMLRENLTIIEKEG